MSKTIHKSGKRKTAIARATLRDGGKGKLRVNNILIDAYGSDMHRLIIREPLILSEEIADKVDIDVTVSGGGPKSRAEASRLAISRCLAELSPKLKNVLLAYDRNLLVADVRFHEASKPNMHGTSRGKKQKSYR